MPEVESRLLAQARMTTVPTSIYTPPALTIGVMKILVVTNTSTTNTTYRIFLDIDGATYDEDSAMFWDVLISGNTYDVLPLWVPFTSVANLAVAASDNDRLTVTIGGYEIVEGQIFRERPLGQVRPGVADVPVSIFSPTTGVRGVVRSLVATNVASGGKAATYSVYLDHDGTTFDDTTALARVVSLATGSTDIVPLYLPMEDAAGNLAVETSDGASEVTFTAFGFLEVVN